MPLFPSPDLYPASTLYPQSDSTTIPTPPSDPPPSTNPPTDPPVTPPTPPVTSMPLPPPPVATPVPAPVINPNDFRTNPEIIAALQGSSGARQISFRYEWLNGANGILGNLPQVVTGSVAYDSTAEVKRTGHFTLVETSDPFDYLNDRIRPWVQFTLASGGIVEWPCGVFLLSTPTRVLGVDGSVQRQAEAYDQSVILQGDQVADRYSVTAGTKYTTAIATALGGYGFTINIVDSPLTLPVSIDWAGGTSKLTILNDLLAAINYKSAWFDATGVFQAVPYDLPDTVEAIYVYASDEDSVLVGEIDQTVDLFAVPNRWVLVVSDADRAVLTSVYVNTAASSPTSTVSRGRTITSYLPNQTAADQATLDALTKKQAYTDSQVFETVAFATAIMPFHSDLSVIGIAVDGLGIATAKFQELSWSFDLTAGATMSHSVRRSLTV